MEIALPLSAGFLDPLEDRADGVDEREENIGDLVVEIDLSVPQLAEEMLAAVRDRPELGETEESARPLDRVDGAKDAPQPLGIARVLLEGNEVLVELVEILGRFDEEVPHVFLVVVHSPTVRAGDRRHAHPHSDTIHRGFGGLACPPFLPRRSQRSHR